MTKLNMLKLTDAETVAWMREDGMKAMTSLEKDAWVKSGRIELVKDYNKPLSHKLKPLSEENISKLAVCGVFKGDAKTITRALEAAHGITDKAYNENQNHK